MFYSIYNYAIHNQCMFIIYMKSVSNQIWSSKKWRDFETDSEFQWIIIIFLSFELNVIKMEDVLPAKFRHLTLIFVSLNSFKKEHLNDLKIEINFGTNNDDIGRLLPLLPLHYWDLRVTIFRFKKFWKILKFAFFTFLVLFCFLLRADSTAEFFTGQCQPSTLLMPQ